MPPWLLAFPEGKAASPKATFRENLGEHGFPPPTLRVATSLNGRLVLWVAAEGLPPQVVFGGAGFPPPTLRAATFLNGRLVLWVAAEGLPSQAVFGEPAGCRPDRGSFSSISRKT